MTDKSKRIMAMLIASVLLVFLLAFIAIGAYSMGRNSNSIVEVTLPPNVAESATSSGKDADETASGEEEEAEEVNSHVDGAEEEGDAGSSADQDLSQEVEASDPHQDTSVEIQEESKPRIPVDLDEIDSDLLIEVWELINREFDGSLPDSDDVTYRSIMGSMELLDDQFTRFIRPEIAERSRIQIQGGYEGIGAYVDMTEDGKMVIVRPIDGQPADEAGILAGDVVTMVDGQSIVGMPLTEIVSMVTGPQGTSVKLTIQREETGETLEFTIVRDRIEFPVVASRMIEEDIGYVRLSSFSNGASDKLTDAIEELLEQKPIGLILDLRDNLGGLLVEAIEISDLFLPEGIVAYQRDSQGIERIFESDDGDLAENIPLVVLVNGGSASGSEIVAGAIDDLDRGILIGEKTLGKGSVQQSYTLSDGSELRVTIARWYTPNNITIDKEGIHPDIEVETPADLGGEEDTQLQRAIEHLRGNY